MGDGEGSLAGRAVLVTGATGPGIASGICQALAAAGARLVVNGLTEHEVAATVGRHPGSVGVVGDVSRPEDVERMLADATARVGPLTGLVNNAGVGLRAPFFEADEAQFDHVLGVDLRGVWLVSRGFARQCGSTVPGAIVNISSVHARSTIAGYGIYASAKAAVEGFTRGCAVELGPHGVRCNAIAPGYVPVDPALGDRTHAAEWIDRHTREEQPLPRLIEPIDCGWAVRFLLSEESRCITGQVLTVDAGLTARLYDAGTTGRLLADRASAGGP